MSDEQSPPPPPGYQPFPPEQSAPPAWGGPPVPGQFPGQFPGQVPGPSYAPMVAVHRPGAIPLRPLGLGDLYDAAFRIIRHNPLATAGAAVIVSAVALVIPVATALVTGDTGRLPFGEPGQQPTTDQLYTIVAAIGSLAVAGQVQAFGLLFVSGMISHVVLAAAVGRTMSLGEAWAATRGKRWRLIGLSLLVGLALTLVMGAWVGLVLAGILMRTDLATMILVAVLTFLVAVVVVVVLFVRVRALAVPALMLEPVGVFGALRRAVVLSRRQFWRLFGILLLTGLIVGIAGSLLRTPFAFGGQALLLTSDHGLTYYLLLTSLGTLLSTAITAPFGSCVSALLYLDERIRKEAFEVELMTRAGILPG